MEEFTVDDSEQAVRDVLSKLSFISKIKEGEIVDVESLSLMGKCISTGVYRTLIRMGTESRETTLKFFVSTVDEAFELVEYHLAQKGEYEHDMARMIMRSLKECKLGLKEHTKTYEHDRMHTSKVETLLKTIDTKTNDILRRYKK